MLTPSLRQLAGAALLLGLTGACAQTPTNPDGQATTARSHETIGVPESNVGKRSTVPGGMQIDGIGLGMLILR